MAPRNPGTPDDPSRRGVDPREPVVDPAVPPQRRVEGEYYVDPLEAERLDREISEEKLERDNKLLIALTVLALLVGAAGLFFGLTANDKAEDAEARAETSAARSTGAAAVTAEVNRQLEAKDAALQNRLRATARRVRSANRTAGSAKNQAQGNASKINSLVDQNEQLRAQINSLRSANQATNRRLDRLQQRRNR